MTTLYHLNPYYYHHLQATDAPAGAAVGTLYWISAFSLPAI